jgi:hypothetical protein
MREQQLILRLSIYLRKELERMVLLKHEYGMKAMVNLIW